MHGRVIGDFALLGHLYMPYFSCFFFLFDIGQLFCVVRLGSLEPLLCAAILPIPWLGSLERLLCAAVLPISGLLKQRRHRDEAGGCDVHHCGATLYVLIVGGGQDKPSPCETSGIGLDKERWGDRCDDLPLCERTEGRVASARETRHCGVACILDIVLGSTMHLW